MYHRMALFFLLMLTFSMNTLAFTIDEDIYINGYDPTTLLSMPMTNYTVLDKKAYHQIVQSAQETVKELLVGLEPYRNQNKETQIAYIVDALLDIPYMFSGATGEGDWESRSNHYKPGALHIKQDPVYRFDGLDCQTFVQVVMALLHANSLPHFEKNLLQIAYGAAGNPNDEIVHYYNRNNFVDGDWNPINQKNGYLADVTRKGPLSEYAKQITVNLTRQQWFITQQKNKNSVRVLNETDGPKMLEHFSNDYKNLQFPHFDQQKVNLAYIPKQLLALRQPDGSFLPNDDVLDLIPTPSVIEIVRDTKKWEIGGKNIKDIIGSELSISHMGILYRRTFKYGDLIYLKIECNYDSHGEKVCGVTPIVCLKDQCTKLMMAHPTTAYPNNFVFAADQTGQYTCSPFEPPGKVAYTRCNRVEQKPLFNYFTDIRYGQPGYMEEPSILGIHVEHLL